MDDLVRSLVPRGFDVRVRTLAGILFLDQFGRTMVIQFLPLYYVALGAPVLLVGVAITISAGTSAFSQAIGGMLADSWGRRKSMLLSTAGRVVTLALLSIFATAIPWFITIFLLITISEAFDGMFLVSASTMMSDLVEARRQVEGFGIFRVAVNLGFTFGSLLGGLLILYTLGIYIWTLLITANLILLALFVKETHHHGRTAFRFRGMLSVSRDRFLLTFSLASVGAGIIMNQMGPTFALYSTQYIGITKQALGYLYFLNGIIVILFQYAFSRFALKYRLGSLIVVSVVIQSASYLLVGLSSSLLLLQVVVVGLTVGEMLQAPSGTAFAEAIAPGQRRGEYIGFYSWGWNSGQALSPVVGGLLLSLFAGSEYLAWYVIPIFGVFCSIAFVSIGRTVRKSNRAQGRNL